MNPVWRKVDNVREFLASRGVRVSGRHTPVHFGKGKKSTRVIPWPYCSRCGLLFLKNDVTARAIREPCVVEE